MTTEVDGLDRFDDQVAALETRMGSATSMAAAFDAELEKMRASLSTTGRGVDTLARGMSKGLRRAFDGVVLDGLKLSDALETIAQSMINTAYSAAITPVTKHFGGLLADGVNSVVSGLFGFANGGAFTQGRVMPFANGGVISQATYFPMRGATGLMGEAGPEAIMPLARGPNGRLGVEAAGGGQAVNVVMNISTPDADSFARSQGQIAAQMSRVLGRAQRNR